MRQGTAAALPFVLSVTLMFSAVAAADPWEPGFSMSISHSPGYEIEGEKRNAMDGELTGLTINTATSGRLPARASVYYALGTSAFSGTDEFRGIEANERVLDVQLVTGKSLESGGIEVIPFVGFGFYEMRQSFDFGSFVDAGGIIVPQRKHRYFYVPFGFYVGSTSPLDMVNIFYQVTLKPVLTGEAKVGGGDNKARMNIAQGFGFDVETGFHFPTKRNWNVFTSVYYREWNIGSSSKGAIVNGDDVTVVRDIRTKHTELGGRIGIQF